MSEDSDPESPGKTALEVVDVLLRRIDLVESLLDEPKDKRSLVDDLEISRSTVDRATRELETAGLVKYVDGNFAITPFGRLSATRFSDLVERIGLRQQLDSFLQWVPESRFSFDLDSIADADIYLPEPGNPYNMVNRHVETIEEASTVRAVLPVTGLHAFEAARDAVVDGGADYEFVVIPEIAEAYESNPNYAPLYEEMAETGRFDLYVYNGDVPYYLGLLDGTVQIGVDEDGDPRAMLETDSDEMRDWAEEEYESYKQQAKKRA